MAATALVQTRIDPALKERAVAVLGNMGLTISDAVRILLARVANEGALPFAFATDPAVHDAWFRAKVQEALNASGRILLAVRSSALALSQSAFLK